MGLIENEGSRWLVLPVNQENLKSEVEKKTDSGISNKMAGF
jgi:hypothetical protein